MVVLPSSLIGSHLGKWFEFTLNKILISQHIRIVGFSFFIISFINIYVTVKLCNQGFREIPEYFRDFAKSLIWSVISRNP